MASSVIGALRVNLGIDTAAFTDGLKQAQSSLAKAGQSLTSVGQTLTARVSAPIAAAAGAIGIGLSGMAKDLADLGNQAKIANASVESFQKLAFAARTVGIEQDKLADILKDVNDKVGDFLSTGGGEMKSFFETIAPKVGITADAFRGLSGPDALQLYVSSLEKAGLSQSEMTFYLEAIADEASALAPLLANNGAELGRLGEQASRFGLASQANVESAKRFKEAMAGLSQAAQALGRAFIDSGVLEVMTGLIERVTGWVAALNQANPRLTQFTLIAGGLAAALGPVLVALGLAVTAIGAIGAPIALAIAGIAALGAAAVAFKPHLDALDAAVGEFAVSLGQGFMQAVTDAKTHLDDLDAYMAGLVTEFLQIGRDIIDGLLSGLREKWAAVKEWFTGLADSIPQWVRDKLGIQSPSKVFAEIGQNIMQGLSGGLSSMTGQVEGQVSSFGTGIAQTFADVLTGATSFRDAMSSILQNVGSSMINAGIGSIGKSFGIPGFARGTSFAPGGLAMVGERGPELVNLPRGSRVTPNNALRGMGTSVTQNIIINNPTGNSEIQRHVVAGVAQATAQMRREVPGISLRAQQMGRG